MSWELDPESQTAYLYVKGHPGQRVTRTKEAHEGRVYVDLDPHGAILGVEVLGVTSEEDCWPLLLCVLTKARWAP